MADAPESSPKIDSLRAKVRADEKSRHFYPLAEELRKIGQLDEAEKVLRAGLQHHSSYLSAWISLGRVLKDRKAYAESIDVLMRGLSLDPENVVAAKLLANVYLAMGEKVEAIKKFKLVHALMPADDDAEEQIARLESELSGEASEAASEQPPPPVEDVPPMSEPASQSSAESQHDSMEPPFPTDQADPAGLTGETAMEGVQSAPAGLDEANQGKPNFDLTNPDPFSLGPPPVVDPELPDESEPFADAELPTKPAAEVGSRDEGPVASEEDPFGVGEPESREPEQPRRAPSSEDVWADEAEVEGGELPASAETVTMAQILVQQGHVDRARETYERILTRDPDNAEARNGLAAISESEPEPMRQQSSTSSRADRLEAWRRKVVRS